MHPDSQNRPRRRRGAPTAPTTLRKVAGQYTLDETLSETDRIDLNVREILDVNTVDRGAEVTLIELKDAQRPDSMKRAMARRAEAAREKRPTIINAEGESLAAAATLPPSNASASTRSRICTDPAPSSDRQGTKP